MPGSMEKVDERTNNVTITQLHTRNSFQEIPIKLPRRQKVTHVAFLVKALSTPKEKRGK